MQFNQKFNGYSSNFHNFYKNPKDFNKLDFETNFLVSTQRWHIKINDFFNLQNLFL